jgi:O-antigen/teichoic acid export membrane protein
VSEQTLPAKRPKPPAPDALPAVSPAGGRLGVAHFVRGLTALGLAQVMSWAGSLVAVVLMPRYLGAAGLGRLSVVTSVVAVFLIASDLGISMFQAKEVAKNPDQASGLYMPAMMARLAAAVVVALIAAFTFHRLFADPVIQVTGYVASGLIVTGAFQGSYATLQGLHRAPLVGATTTINVVAVAALTAAVLFRGGGPVACAAAAVAGAALSQAASAVLLFRHFRPHWTVSPRLMWRVVRGGIPFVAWSAALTAYSQIDIVMLNVMTRPDVVGWYAAALRLVMIPVFVPSLVLTIGFPVLAASAADTRAFAAVARQVLRVIMLVSLPLAVGMAILPQDITHALRYPATFSNAWLPLRLLALQFPLVAADMVIGSALMARDRQRQWTITAVTAAVLNPLLNLWAIPYTQRVMGNGAVGAAAVTAVTELYMMCVGLWLLPRDVYRWADLGMVARILAACVPMAIVAYLLSGHFIAIPVVAGGAAFALAALAAGAVSIGDLRMLSRVMRNRGDRSDTFDLPKAAGGSG